MRRPLRLAAWILAALALISLWAVWTDERLGRCEAAWQKERPKIFQTVLYPEKGGKR